MYICDECHSTKTYVKDDEYSFDIKDKKYSIISKRRFCKQCNNIVYDEELDEELLRKIYKKQEEIIGIDPTDIINLRKQYKLSQEQFAKIIGCAKKTLISYEKGTSIPNDIYLVTIKTLLDNPGVIRFMIDSNLERYTKDELFRINNKINSNNMNNILGPKEENYNDLNGYTDLNKDKVYNLILLLSDKGILKTKLLKEMFYCDFLYYKKTMASITGLEYAKLDYGPVPDDFENILKYLISNDYIKYEVSYNNEYESHKIIKNKKVNKKVFRENELEIINRVKTYFKDYTVKDIVDKSHKEKAFTDTEYYNLISYDYSFDINLE